jgi:hypothetical protein
MRKTIHGAAALMVASALAVSSIGVSAAAAASATLPEQASQTIDLSARSHHHHHYHHYRHYYHHHHGNGRAALRTFGAIAGIIGGLAARDECRHYGGCYYGYAYPPPGYYYGPRYYPYY